jgi:hypothetical protein
MALITGEKAASWRCRSQNLGCMCTSDFRAIGIASVLEIHPGTKRHPCRWLRQPFIPDDQQAGQAHPVARRFARNDEILRQNILT